MTWGGSVHTSLIGERGRITYVLYLKDEQLNITKKEAEVVRVLC